jgi:hypothetical protein
MSGGLTSKTYKQAGEICTNFIAGRHNTSSTTLKPYVHYPKPTEMTKKTMEAEMTQMVKVAKEKAIQWATKMYQDQPEGPESSCIGL